MWNSPYPASPSSSPRGARPMSQGFEPTKNRQNHGDQDHQGMRPLDAEQAEISIPGGGRDVELQTGKRAGQRVADGRTGQQASQRRAGDLGPRHDGRNQDNPGRKGHNGGVATVGGGVHGE